MRRARRDPLHPQRAHLSAWRWGPPYHPRTRTRARADGHGVNSVATGGTPESPHGHALAELHAMGISWSRAPDAVASERNGWRTHPPASPISGSPAPGAGATSRFGRFYLCFWHRTTWRGSIHGGGCLNRPPAPMVPHWNQTGLSTGLFAESVQYRDIRKLEQ